MRIDAPDTVDVAVGFLHRLQSEGWGTRDVEWRVDYAAPHKTGREIPVGATVTIRLIPAKGHR